ncbi:hypothetical protein IW18_01220 [Flavobacterium hibernum]|uniref:Uncharacterized protein n=1 Tax=Flavobacterium hibernum TaxID=37752 RepID=A0A0D0ENJ5_9FLAO|nr:hypothetical protein IW18_01220 [Flavobacterium hibernum]
MKELFQHAGKQAGNQKGRGKRLPYLRRVQHKNAQQRRHHQRISGFGEIVLHFRILGQGGIQHKEIFPLDQDIRFGAQRIEHEKERGD